MPAHRVPLPGRPRRSGALVLLLTVSAVLGALIAAPALGAADGTTARVNVTQTEPGVVQPEPAAPQLSGPDLSPLAVGIVVVTGAAMATAAGFAVVSRRRRRR